MKKTILISILISICLLLFGCKADVKLIKPSDVSDDIWNGTIKYTSLVLGKIDKLDIKIGDKIEVNPEALLAETEIDEIFNFFNKYYKLESFDNEKLLLTNLYNLTGNYMFVKVNIEQYNDKSNKLSTSALTSLLKSLEQSKACAERIASYTKTKISPSMDKSINTIKKHLQI